MNRRAAIVVAGPSGFYTAEQLLKAGWEVDLRGLVVAPWMPVTESCETQSGVHAGTVVGDSPGAALRPRPRPVPADTRQTVCARHDAYDVVA